MALRTGARLLTPALRRVMYQQARATAPRQFTSSAHHGASESSDKAWIVRLQTATSLFVDLTSIYGGGIWP
jgi:hypothetical protein